MNLKNQLPRKFLKKNLLLQKDLEGFLHWRQNQKRNSCSIFIKRNRYPFNSFNNNKKNLYKPVKFEFFKALRLNEFFFLNFFSAKKPFMTLWFFPLFGMAFLTLVHSSDKSSSTFEIPPSSAANLILNNDSFSSLSSNNLKGTYSSKNLQIQLNHRKNSLNEIEDMCSFYLKQTTNKLNPMFQNIFQTENSKDLLVNNIWFQSKRLNKSYFDWIWYSLKINNQTIIYSSSFENNDSFPQKLRTPDWALKPKKISSSIESGSIEVSNRPNLAYLKASLLLDNWIRRGSFLTASEMTQKKLDRLEISDLILDKLEKGAEVEKRTQLGSYLFSLFEMIQQNQLILKKIDVTMNSAVSSLGNVQTPFVNNFKNNCLEKYNADFLKLWFKHYLQNQSLNAKIHLKNQAIRENPLPSLKQNTIRTRFPIHKLLKKTTFLNDFQNFKQRKLVVHFKKMNLLKAKKIESDFNSDLDLTHQRIYSKTYELMLLKNWNLILKPIIKTDVTNDERRVDTIKQQKNLAQFLHELNIYRKFSKLSSRILDFEQKLSKNSDKKLGKNSFVFSYKNPILQGTSQKGSLEDVLSVSILKNDFKFFQNKEFEITKKQLLSKPQFRLKQSLFSNNNICESTPVFIDLDKPSKTLAKLANSKDNNKLLQFCQQYLKEFVSFSKFLDGSVLKDSSNIDLLSLKPKKKFVSKSFELKDRKTFVFSNFKKFETGLINGSEQLFEKKPMKQKINLTVNFSNLSNERRQIEKIFRTYNSIKFTKSQNRLKFLQVFEKTSKAEASKGQIKKNRRSDFEFSSFQNVFTLLKQRVQEKRTFDNKGVNISNYYTLSQNRNILRKSDHSILNSIYLNPVNVQREKKQPLILSSSKLSKKLICLNFLKRADFSNNSFDSIRFENQKRLEKKRRLKKLKLENRRRKKRKRFYPRPPSLRFQVYSVFIKNRYHPLRKLNFFTKSPNICTKGLNKNNFQGKISRHSFKSNLSLDLKDNFPIEKTSNEKKIRKGSFNNKIYRLNKQRWGNVFNSVTEKVSFQRMFLALNQPTYHRSEFYKISNDILADFEKLCWKSYWLRSNIKPYIHRVQNNLKQIQVFERLKNHETSFKSLVKQSTKSILDPTREALRFFKNKPLKQRHFYEVSFYPNTKATVETGWNHFQNTHFFKILEKKTEYETLMYNRIRDQIKNVKSQLNVNGENQARSYKTGRQKFEVGSNANPFSVLSRFGKNLFEPAMNNLPFFSLSNDNIIKPFGDMATLRILWTCHQTNLLTYHDTNFSKTLWSTYKNREQLKSNKTRKFLLKIFNMYGDWMCSTGIHRNLKTLTQTKTNLISKKTQILLGPINRESQPSYKTRIRTLKFRLKGKPLFQKTKLDPISMSWFETSLQTKLQKGMPHFWWATKQKNPIEIPFSIFLSTPSNFLNLSQYFFPRTIFNIEAIERYSLFRLDDFDFNQKLVFTTFWFSCLFFHLSLLFALIRIPEIRNLLKFQFLILSKLSNTYLTAVFWIYRVLSTYKNKLNRFVQQSTFLFRDLKESQYETEIILNKLKLKRFVQQRDKSSRSTISSSVLALITKRLIVDKNRRFRIQESMDLNLVTSFRCRLFFNFIEKHLIEIEIKKEKFEPFSGLDKKSSLLFFAARDSFYQEFTKQHQNLSFTEGKSFVESKNNIYSFFTGWQWYVDNKNASSFLNQPKTELLNRFTEDSEEWVGNFLRRKDLKLAKDNPKLSSRNWVRPATTKISFSFWKNSNIQFQSVLSLLILYITKVFVQFFYFSFVVFYKLLFSIIDCMESFLLVFYKFFEKPAELMITWIADFFLVEWSSDLINYVPDAFDRDIWISFLKFSRSSRFVLPVPFGLFFQRMLLSSSEIFYRWLLKPDSDLITRQRKGIVFWDIWSEILILAAEQYKMNLSSLSTVKEEQELLIENLLQDKIVSEPSSEKLNRDSKSLKNVFNLKIRSVLETSKTFSPPQGFFTSPRWTQSFEKLEPLLVFLKTKPSNPASWYHKEAFSNQRKQFNFELFQQFNNVGLSIRDLQLPRKSNINEYNIELSNKKNSRQPADVVFDWIKSEASERWSVNQTLTTQGRDTDLFMDIHPPKSFVHVGFLKNYLAPQEILGSLVCEIYSGQFPMKISKNILIVGAPGRAKSFFIQALAGETESKIVIDNANRYTFVNGGVPIGMKLLREVFDSIALHTPCLFLLEDIHIIGERRPMLISDDEISKSKTDTFGAEQEEVHEKDRSVYQLSRHALSHYNRPYKGDFSLSIPTNHFCYDLFLGVSATRKRLSNLSAQTPLSLKTIEQNLIGQQKTEEASFSRDPLTENFKQSNSFVSFLQLSIDQVFAPPVTSPFNILLLKEQKKLKPKKIVKEMPWSGLSHDQLMLISKTSYSIRVKVAMLAELSMTNLSMKLDMITDLLVIIDSVRSNRGFVVFATTHLPALLDPALRRPGRLDETISLPNLPNLMSRFEIFRLNTSFTDEPVNFFDYSLLSPSTNENQIEAFISKGMLLLLNTKGKMKKKSMSLFYSNFFKDYSIYSLSQAFRSILFPNSAFINSFCSLRSLNFKITKSSLKTSMKDELQVLSSVQFSSNDKLPYLSLTYSKAGRFLIEAVLLQNHSIYSTQFFQSSRESKSFDLEGSAFNILYSSQFENSNTFLKLFAGKISEFFVFNSSSLSFKKPRTNIFSKTPLLNPSQSGLFDTLNSSDTYWKSALDFLDSFFQKRYLYNKNLIASKLLFLEDLTILRQVPSPPNSSILMPAKKFENYKRTLKDFTQKPMFTINEKIQSHQQQRFLKLLYNIPLESSFQTISKSKSMFLNRNLSNLETTTFYSSFKELGYLDLITLKPSSASSFYKNRFLIRHRFSFLNQWWNGQLAEHNIETTYVSHVDWRSMFVPSIGDLIIDFPDAEQYYNPRSRRWFLQSTSWSYWFDFEQQFRTSIYQHYIYQAFVKTFEFLDQNRELLDYLAFRFLRQHQLKEIDLTYVLLRFQKKSFEMKE